MMRLRNVVWAMVMLLVYGASSQAAVCELACGSQVQAVECHATDGAPGVEHGAMEMTHAHCAHAIGATSLHGIAGSVVRCFDGNCGHASLPVFAKAGSSSVSFYDVQWVAVAVVPLERKVTGGTVDVGRRRPLLPGGVGPLLVSLRV